MPSNFRWQAMSTLAYCASFVGLGMLSEALGPCLPGLSERFGLNSAADLSPVLVGRGVGYSVGTLGMGKLIEIWPTRGNVMLSAAALAMAALNVFVPLASVSSSGLLLLGALIVARATMAGALDVGGNILIVRVWEGDPRAGPAMNLLHLSWGLGAFLSPVLVRAVGIEPDGLPRSFAVLSVVGAVTGLWCALVRSPARPAPPLSAPSPRAALTPAAAGGAEAKETAVVETEAGTPPVGEAAAGGRSATCDSPTGSDDSGGSGEGAGSLSSFPVVFGALFLYYFAYSGAEKISGDW
jgi:hypothetical protein